MLFRSDRAEAERVLQGAIRNYFNYRYEFNQRELKQLLRYGWTSLLIAVGFLGICVSAAQAINPEYGHLKAIVLLSGRLVSSCIALPSAEQIMRNAKLVENFTHRLVQQILNGFGLMVEGRHRREDGCSGQCQCLHVANVDQCQRGLPRNDDQPAPLL